MPLLSHCTCSHMFVPERERERETHLQKSIMAHVTKISTSMVDDISRVQREKIEDNHIISVTLSCTLLAIADLFAPRHTLLPSHIVAPLHLLLLDCCPNIPACCCPVQHLPHHVLLLPPACAELPAPFFLLVVALLMLHGPAHAAWNLPLQKHKSLT